MGTKWKKNESFLINLFPLARLILKKWKYESKKLHTKWLESGMREKNVISISTFSLKMYVYNSGFSSVQYGSRANEALHLYLKVITQCISVNELDETVGSEDTRTSFVILFWCMTLAVFLRSSFPKSATKISFSFQTTTSLGLLSLGAKESRDELGFLVHIDDASSFFCSGSNYDS